MVYGEEDKGDKRDKRREFYKERVLLPSPLGEIPGVWYRPSSGSLGHTLITSHGLLSHKETSKYRLLAQRFCQKGLKVFSFDFSGCGESSGSLLESRVSTRIQELALAIEYVENAPGTSSISLMGSSMGGYISLHLASTREDVVESVVIWASPLDLSFFLEDEAYHFDSLGPSFYQELKEGQYSKAPSSVKNLLIIHGKGDQVIPYSHAKRIYEEAEEPKRLRLIEGADHRFSQREHRQEAINLTLDWVREFL